MSEPINPELHADLLDDFYAECDELLAAIRSDLARAEASMSRSESAGAALEGLFRGMHTVKGNAAIVGLRAAEQLAHATEDFVRVLSSEEVPLTESGLGVLTDAAYRLEQIVSAHRQKQPIPGIADLVDILGAHAGSGQHPMPDPESVSGRFSRRDAVARRQEALSRALALWTCTFSPSAELDARGVNLSSVRMRLAGIGEIIRATPRIGGNGLMAFEFELALKESPGDLTTFRADGMEMQPVKPAGDAPHRPDGGSTLFIAPSHIVRVDMERLDDLMRITGELVIHRSRLEERMVKLETARQGGLEGLREVNTALGRSLRDLREAITRVRLVSVGQIFARMPFVVRDLAEEAGKSVRLVLEGEQTEIDKYLVERLKEPLLHLVRNALTHGIEPPDARLAAGKPSRGTITLSATAEGDSVVLQIQDDGRGVDATVVAGRARKRGMSVPEMLDETALLGILCSSGFSTREETDRAAGRGVGMSVVQKTVRELGGSLSLKTSPGQWTRFTLRLPLTLSIAEAIIVSAGGQMCAVPQGKVRELIQLAKSLVRTVNGMEVVPYRGGLLPVVRLCDIFKRESGTGTHLVVLVLEGDRGLSGLAVDQVHGQREVVVRSMLDPLIQVPGISGVTELGDGRPILILDAATLTHGTARPRAMDSGEEEAPRALELAEQLL